MRKRLFLSIVPLILVAGLIVPAPALAEEETVVSVKNNPEITKGDSLTATVEINQVTDLSSFQFNISFNPEILSLENVAGGQIGGASLPVKHIEIEDGIYLVWFQSEEAVSGSGTLGTITFLALEDGNTNIALKSGTLEDSQSTPITAVWLGNSITVLPDGEQGAAETPSAEGEDNVDLVFFQPVESETIYVGAEEESTAKATEASKQEGDIKWPVIGGIAGGALIMVILAALPKSGKEKGYLD